MNACECGGRHLTPVRALPMRALPVRALQHGFQVYTYLVQYIHVGIYILRIYVVVAAVRFCYCVALSGGREAEEGQDEEEEMIGTLNTQVKPCSSSSKQTTRSLNLLHHHHTPACILTLIFPLLL